MAQGCSGNKIPADEDAEKCVLSALLEHPNARGELGISADLFYFPTSKTIFGAIQALRDSGAPGDIIVLTQYLDRVGRLEEVGGAPAITRLATEYSKSLAVARYEVAILRENYRKRRLAELAVQLAQHARNGADAVEVIRDVRKELSQIEDLCENARKPLIEFKTPSQLRAFQPTTDAVLVGDRHVVRGAMFVIAGAPGVGKSRATIALAIAGATGGAWFGLLIRTRFKTMIVQNENGQFRLKDEFRDLDCETLDTFIRICPPPVAGLCFERSGFRETLCGEIKMFRPDLIIIDPWNQVARDEKARDYLDTFNLIREVIPAGDESPAIGIVAHTRKPRVEEKISGRGLLNSVAGSHILVSVPRAVFVMQSATDEIDDDRVVWTCCKNNDGEIGRRSVWHRRNGLFHQVTDFNFEDFDSADKGRRALIAEADVAATFEGGREELTRTQAVERLELRTDAKRSTCYNALELDGKFGRHLREAGDGKLIWIP
jgi:DnaB-like helicase N terminal domain/AAA domain